LQFSNDPMTDLKRTFRKPHRQRSQVSSLLTLLRNDLQAFYGPEASVGGTVAAPLLTSLGICTGLELLAKYWSGLYDIDQKVFIKFLTDVAMLEQSQAEELMQFRNSLAHGYALGTRRRKDKQLFSFTIDTRNTMATQVVVSSGANEYIVNIWSLKKFFLVTIGRCRKAIASDPCRLGDFQVCLRNLGEIGIQT
jgi:hypothetical protein